MSYLHQLILYSIPICTDHFEYHSDANQFRASNFARKNQDSTMMKNVNYLDLGLIKIIRDHDERSKIDHRLFGNVTELRLGIDGDWPRGSHELLSTTIDLLHITKLFLSVNFSSEYMPSIIVHGIHRFLEHVLNIHILSLFDYWAPDHCTTAMEIVWTMITSNIKRHSSKSTFV